MIRLYPDTPHGFHADYRPSYRKDQAADGLNHKAKVERRKSKGVLA
jgi:hypothetical protein